MLEPPDSFHLSAASGWLGLNNPAEAQAELDRISAPSQDDSNVLTMRLDIYLASQKWAEAERLARRLVEMVPTDPHYWISLAYATRRKPKGGIPQAKLILENAATIFPSESTIFFNLACYNAQLGKLPEARKWLDHALAVGHKTTLRQMIADDPDLEVLRDEYVRD